MLANGRGLRLSPESHLVNNSYLIAVTLDAGSQSEGTIHVAAPASEELIRQRMPAADRDRTAVWNGTRGKGG